MQTIPKHKFNKDCEFLKKDGCYWCCERCNYDKHQCPGCGDELKHNGLELSGKEHKGCID
jgi:hypothetical protein